MTDQTALPVLPASTDRAACFDARAVSHAGICSIVHLLLQSRSDALSSQRGEVGCFPLDAIICRFLLYVLVAEQAAARARGVEFVLSFGEKLDIEELSRQCGIDLPLAALDALMSVSGSPVIAGEGQKLRSVEEDWDIDAILGLLGRDCLAESGAGVAGRENMARLEGEAGFCDRGFLITLEGGDGAGKTSQSRLLAEGMRERWGQGTNKKISVCYTHAIGGGSETGQAIRSILINPSFQWSLLSDILLTIISARDAVKNIVVPALLRGEWVVCDRFIDTMVVYLCEDGPSLVTAPAILALYDAMMSDVCVGLRPDLTFLLDVSYEVAVSRQGHRLVMPKDRIEAKGEGFHRRVLESYRKISLHSPRVIRINAERPVDELTEKLLSFVDSFLLCSSLKSASFSRGDAGALP